MEDHSKLLKELYQIESFGNNRERLNGLTKMNSCLFELVQNLFDEGVKIKYHEREVEGKFFRYGLANQSIINLINGNKFVFFGKEINLLDVDSLYSITRMQIENFLIIFYLFFDNVSDEEKDFRYDVYKLHGVQKQSNFKVTNLSSETIKDLKSIDIEIATLQTKISQSSFYKIANEKQRQDYLTPKFAKLIKSEVIFSRSGITKSKIDEMWKIYSNYAHGEHIGDRQYNYRKNNQQLLNETVTLLITINKILTAKLIFFLRRAFEVNEAKYLGFDPKSRLSIEMFVQL